MDSRIGIERVNFDLVRPLFADIGVTGVHLACDKENHASSYCLGTYNGKLAGVKFGRKPKYYAHEAEGLKRLDHKGIPQCYDVGELRIGLAGYWEPLAFGYLILEHFSGKKLNHALDFSTKEGREKAVGYLLGVVDIMDHMHSRNVVHNDICPEHVIVHDEKPRLIDFHIWEDAPPTQDFCGRRGYPGVILQDLTEQIVPNVDVHPWEPFSFGRFLMKIVPDAQGDALLSGIKSLGENLTHKSDRYVYHPLSRDYTSRKLKEALEKLRSSIG